MTQGLPGYQYGTGGGSLAYQGSQSGQAKQQEEYNQQIGDTVTNPGGPQIGVDLGEGGDAAVKHGVGSLGLERLMPRRQSGGCPGERLNTVWTLPSRSRSPVVHHLGLQSCNRDRQSREALSVAAAESRPRHWQDFVLAERA